MGWIRRNKPLGRFIRQFKGYGTVGSIFYKVRRTRGGSASFLGKQVLVLEYWRLVDLLSKLDRFKGGDIRGRGKKKGLGQLKVRKGRKDRCQKGSKLIYRLVKGKNVQRMVERGRTKTQRLRKLKWELVRSRKRRRGNNTVFGRVDYQLIGAIKVSRFIIRLVVLCLGDRQLCRWIFKRGGVGSGVLSILSLKLRARILQCLSKGRGDRESGFLWDVGGRTEKEVQGWLFKPIIKSRYLWDLLLMRKRLRANMRRYIRLGGGEMRQRGFWKEKPRKLRLKRRGRVRKLIRRVYRRKRWLGESVLKFDGSGRIERHVALYETKYRRKKRFNRWESEIANKFVLRKQICRFFGGLKLRELWKYRQYASVHLRGMWDKCALRLFECRLDLFLIRSNLVRAFTEAYELIHGGLVIVNGVGLTSYYYVVGPGDEVGIQPNLVRLFQLKLIKEFWSALFSVGEGVGKCYIFPAYLEVSFRRLVFNYLEDKCELGLMPKYIKFNAALAINCGRFRF